MIKSNLLLIGLFCFSFIIMLIGVVCVFKKLIVENELIFKGLNGLNKCMYIIKWGIGVNFVVKVGNVLIVKSF